MQGGQLGAHQPQHLLAGLGWSIGELQGGADPRREAHKEASVFLSRAPTAPGERKISTFVVTGGAQVTASFYFIFFVTQRSHRELRFLIYRSILGWIYHLRETMGGEGGNIQS